jgi:hypothetical protein
MITKPEDAEPRHMVYSETTDTACLIFENVLSIMIDTPNTQDKQGRRESILPKHPETLRQYRHF